jgi:hypothetical protein
MLQEIKGLEAQIVTIKDEKTNVDRKISFVALPQTEKFFQCNKREKTLYGQHQNDCI